jgi:hypothetical protein
MSTSWLRRSAQRGSFARVFSGGCVLGTLDAEAAQAPVQELGEGLINEASEQSGALGTAAQLGTTISDMQTHVNELQKNLETLNKIEAALGG